MKTCTIRLTLTVMYDLAEENSETLKNYLRDIPNQAASNGLMTGDSAATVEEWHATVEEIL